MEYQVIPNDESITVTLSGRLTFSDASAFPKLLSSISRPGLAMCEFDMARLDFIDSTGMSLLIHAYDQARESGFSVRLRNAGGPVRAALERAGFPALFEMA
jgi:anti-anti-sigma factor